MSNHQPNTMNRIVEPPDAVFGRFDLVDCGDEWKWIPTKDNEVYGYDTAAQHEGYFLQDANGNWEEDNR